MPTKNKKFCIIKKLDHKVLIFNKIILNILSNFVHHEVTVRDNKNRPGSTNKTKIANEKRRTHKIIVKRQKFLDNIA